MNDIPSPAPRRRWLRRLILGGLVALCLLIATHVIWLLSARADLRAARAEAAAAGLAAQLAQVVPPACPEAENAARCYERAFGLMSLGGKPYVSGRDAGEVDARLQKLLSPEQGQGLGSEAGWRASSADQRSAALATLEHEDFARVWRLLAEGARLPRCRWDGDYGAGPGMLLPQITMMRSLARLACLRARLLAETGRGQEAADLLADLLWMRRQDLIQPILIMFLVGNSIDDMSLACLRGLLAEGRLAGADLGRCRAALDGADRKAALLRCIDGEAVLMGDWAFRRMEGGFFGGLSTNEMLIDVNGRSLGTHLYFAVYESWLGAPLRSGDEAAYLRLMAGERQRIAADEAPAEQPLSSPWTQPLTSMLRPALGMISQNLRRQQRLIDGARSALALAAGESPTTSSGVHVGKTADGAWEVSFDPVTVAGQDPAQADKLLQPWRIIRP